MNEGTNPCPSWCQLEHPTGYLLHEAFLEEMNLDGGRLLLKVAVTRHDLPGKIGQASVRLYAHLGGDDGESRIVDLTPDQAATLGRVTALAATAGPAHRLSLALTRAAGLLLTDDAAR